MGYQTAENQVVQLQNQADQVALGIKVLADNLHTKVTDPSLARELALDLREVANTSTKLSAPWVILTTVGIRRKRLHEQRHFRTWCRLRPRNDLVSDILNML